MLSEGPYQGVEVQVLQSGGTAFTEHKIVHTPGQVDHPPTSTCWLEVEQDTIFTINIRLPQAALVPYHSGAWGFKTWVDGTLISYTFDASTGRAMFQLNVSTMVYEHAGRQMAGKLKFTKLKTTSQADDSTRKVYNDESASIQVDIEGGTPGARAWSYAGPHALASHADGGVVEERDAKRTGTAVSAVNGTPASTSSSYAWRPLDPKRPFHRFIFKYRTRPILEILKVIEREATQSPEPRPPKGRKRNRSPGSSDDGGVQREMLQVMLDMRREINGLRQMVTRQENGKRREHVIDLVDSDSD